MIGFFNPKRRTRRREKRTGDFTGRLVTVASPNDRASEAYRVLRTNLLYASIDRPPKAITVTSPNPQEGKSTVCANLGAALAQAGKSTLLMDCDLRKPVQHEIFGLRNMKGLVNVLAGECSLGEASSEYLVGLQVVPAGPISPNPTELLSSRRFADLLDKARREFDYVLMDAPPMQAVSDPTVLGAQGDGVLLVLDAQNTRKVAVQKCVRSLEVVGARVIGTVMNNAKASSRGGYYGYEYRY